MLEKVTVGIATFAAALIIGAVFGRLHKGTPQPIGDRVLSGLLSLPLILILVHLAFPCLHTSLKLIAPVPMAIYTVSLASTDWKWKQNKKDPFTRNLVIAVLVLYILAFVVALSTGALEDIDRGFGGRLTSACS